MWGENFAKLYETASNRKKKYISSPLLLPRKVKIKQRLTYNDFQVVLSAEVHEMNRNKGQVYCTTHALRCSKGPSTGLYNAFPRCILTVWRDRALLTVQWRVSTASNGKNEYCERKWDANIQNYIPQTGFVVPWVRDSSEVSHCLLNSSEDSNNDLKAELPSDDCLMLSSEVLCFLSLPVELFSRSTSLRKRAISAISAVYFGEGWFSWELWERPGGFMVGGESVVVSFSSCWDLFTNTSMPSGAADANGLWI